ncbi:AAA family ATPase [Pontibacter oryzae]|uniref:ATP-binding cassette family protein n=1 Tax=Pontibacter oryzae TaxID=2304593 RepID=A0A399SHW9_9BACT|nr:AAA family ATPase [Pontibacter oryzae]RIJ42611.1 ATP-binding cassette family protein [Pontibacter oryzae]
MKILSVRFQNLNSLKGEHEIRFDQSPLAEAGLFAITGPTGAGKTTILDAITVGLYGLVHRHSTDKPLELMTRHTAESYSEVTFEANGKKYRSKWHLRRSRGKADGNIQPVHMELFDFSGDTLFDLKPSEVPGKVAELCGLDYNQFLRSVMLSQGDFARFLKANPNERSSLLEKITDTGIYSQISQYAFQKAKEERQKREDLERRLQDTQLLPEEQRSAYQQSIADLRDQETQQENAIKALQEKLHWLQAVAQLKARQTHHQKALQLQEQKLASMQPQFQKLQQHEQAHQFVGELAEIRNANSKVSEVKEELQLLQKRVPTLETELEAAGSIASETTKRQQQQQEAMQKLEPLLAKVNKLDHQLYTIREAYSKNKTAYLSFEEALELQKQELQARQTQLEALTNEATSIKSWLEQHTKLQDLKENLPDLRATLRDLQEAEKLIERTQQEEKEHLQQKEQDAQQLLSLQQEQAQLNQRQVQLQASHTEKLANLQKLLEGKELQDLEAAAQQQPALVARYERMQELAQQHTTQQQKLQNITKQLALHQNQEQQWQLQLQEIAAKHTLAQEHLEALQKLVALQQQIQQYEEARHTLHQGEPCPLCGSEEHPFAEHGYTFDLPEEVKKRDQQQELVKALEKSINQLQLQISSLKQQQTLAHTTKSETESEINRLSQLFGQLTAGLPQSLHINQAEEVTAYLQQHRNTANALQQQLAQARTLSRELESMKQQQQYNREAQVQAQAKFNQLEQSGRLLNNQLQKLQVLLTDAREQQQVHTETAQSFAAAYGQMYKPDQREQLIQSLEQLSVQFSQKQIALQDMREKYIELKEVVRSMNNRVQELEKEHQERKAALKEEHEQLTQLKEERQQLFGDKDPEQERQSAAKALRVCAEQAEAARAKQKQKQQELQEARSRHSECQHKHQQHTSVLEELRQGLMVVLRQKGIETIEALTQMLLERDEADRLANLKAQAEKHLTELRKSCSDVKEELAQQEAKLLTVDTIDTLEQQQRHNAEKQRELIAQRARLEQLLEQDAKQRDKNKELALQLQTQQQVYHRWAQLSDLIGSAEGTKFSRFAQGLTLARLVELANRHLQKLNDRYRILKSSAEDLELLIVDTYQAEAIRPMNTLSGGESFLVSLALALGLSDLAGRRTQINSLFIDEGFGTLDAETLDAAISTLENLQASGKMIGIISHVEALKERIHTQIKVQRQPGGVSKVEVVGL